MYFVLVESCDGLVVILDVSNVAVQIEVLINFVEPP